MAQREWKRLKLLSSSLRLSFDDLPEEVQDRILSDVCGSGSMITPCSAKVAQVCRRWCEFASSRHTICGGPFSSYDKTGCCDMYRKDYKNALKTLADVQKNVLKTLADGLPRFRRTLRSITIEPREKLLLDAIKSASKLPFPMLKTVTVRRLGGLPMRKDEMDEALLAVTRSSPMLKELILHETHRECSQSWSENDIIDTVARSLKDHCLCLASLTLECIDKTRLTVKGCAALGQISSLQSLSLLRLPQLNDEAMELICGGYCSLSELRIDKASLTDRSMRAVASGKATRASLLRLSLDRCDAVTSVGISDILCKCTQLTTIRMWDCKNIINPLGNYAISHPRLKVNLQEVTYFNYSVAATDYGLECVSGINQLKSIRFETQGHASLHLDLQSDRKCLRLITSWGAGPSWKDFLANFPLLENLDIQVFTIDKEAARSIVECVAPRLVTLHVGDASFEALEIIVRGCKRLQILSVDVLPDEHLKRLECMSSCNAHRTIIRKWP